MEWSALREGPCQQWGRRNAGSMDGATQTSFLSPGGSYLRKSRGVGDSGAVDTCAHLPMDVMVSAGNVALPGLQNGLLISVLTVPPHETLQITSLTALNSPCLWRAYTEAANRNHPLYEGRLVSGHRPFMVMDAKEGWGRGTDRERPLESKNRLRKSSKALQNYMEMHWCMITEQYWILHVLVCYINPGLIWQLKSGHAFTVLQYDLLLQVWSFTIGVLTCTNSQSISLG